MVQVLLLVVATPVAGRLVGKRDHALLICSSTFAQPSLTKVGG